MSTTPALNQFHFRIRTDGDAVDATPTWAAAEDVAVLIAVETLFRIRFGAQNTGTASAVGPYVLRVSKNGGAYTAITTSSGATLGAQSADASTSADETAITVSRITGGASAGVYDETGSAVITHPVSTTRELEYGLILKAAGAVPGDTFDFRIYNSTTAFTTYSQTPSIRVPEASGVNFQPKYPDLTPGADQTTLWFSYSAAGTSATTQTMQRAVGAGDLHVIVYAADNVATTDSDENAVTSITDSAGNTYSKGAEWTKSGGALQGGVTAGIWYCQLTNALTTSHTLTVNWSSGTDRDAIAWESRAYTVAAGKSVSVEATATGVSTASTTVPSLNPTTANIECLRVRVNGVETLTSQGFSTRRTPGWVYFGNRIASSGTSATSITLAAEALISTGTGGASSPSALSAAADQCGVYVAFRADVAYSGHVCLANDVSSASSVVPDAGSLLVHADGNDGSTLFSDAAGTHSVTPVNTWVATAESKFGGASAQTTSYAGYLAISNATDITFGTGDFTIDFWVYIASHSGATTLLYECRYNSGAVYTNGPHITIGFDPTNGLFLYANTAYRITSGSIPSQNAWHHVALTRAGTSTRLFLDGTQVGSTYTDTTNYYNADNPTFMGSVSGYGTDRWGDELRIIKGTAAWTANFTPPTGPYQGRALTQTHNLFANDVKSNSAVSQPTMYLPAVEQSLLANDVTSASSVKQATAVIRRDALANDAVSASSVTKPAVQQRQTLLANDVLSPSSVTKPTQLRQLQALLANDVISTSSVKTATALINRGALANDTVSPSSVTQPAQLRQQQALFVNDVASPSSVSNPLAGEIVAGGAEPGESLVLTYSPGSQRNDFGGQVGVRLGIGTADIPIQYIGTRSNGYGGTRTVALYEWFSDALVSSAVIDLTGKAEGDWVWVAVTPFSLLANGYYALMMDVVASDGNWWRNPGPVTMQASIVNIYDSYRVGGGSLATGGTNASFVGLDLGWDIVADTEDDCLANDIVSASSVGQPALKQVQGTLANDVKSSSSVATPAASITRLCLANDVVATSKVTQPNAGIQRALLANDVTSLSFVTAANLGSVGGLFADDIVAPSSVGNPTLIQGQVLLANDVLSSAFVTKPMLVSPAEETGVSAAQRHYWLGVRQMGLGF